MGVRDARMDFLDALDRQGVAGRRLGELVGAVAGADGDGQGVDLGLGDEVGSLFRIGQQLAVIENALGTDAIFLTGGTSLVPAVRAAFAQRFGEARLRGADDDRLTSVALGLAAR